MAHRLLVTSEVLPDLFSKLAPDVWVQGHANAVAASRAGQAARVAVVDTTRSGGLALAAVAAGLEANEKHSVADGLGAMQQVAKRMGGRRAEDGAIPGVSDAALRAAVLDVARSLPPHAKGTVSDVTSRSRPPCMHACAAEWGWRCGGPPRLHDTTRHPPPHPPSFAACVCRRLFP